MYFRCKNCKHFVKAEKAFKYVTLDYYNREDLSCQICTKLNIYLTLRSLETYNHSAYNQDTKAIRQILLQNYNKISKKIYKILYENK